jgi:hypothetical protein
MNYFINYLNQLAPLPQESAEAINQITIQKILPIHYCFKTAMYVKNFIFLKRDLHVFSITKMEKK